MGFQRVDFHFKIYYDLCKSEILPFVSHITNTGVGFRRKFLGILRIGGRLFSSEGVVRNNKQKGKDM